MPNIRQTGSRTATGEDSTSAVRPATASTIQEARLGSTLIIQESAEGGPCIIQEVRQPSTRNSALSHNFVTLIAMNRSKEGPDG